MSWQDYALAAAGLVGAGGAVVHGLLVQRLMVRPFLQISEGDSRFGGAVRRLVPPLLHFSTLAWFLGGLALIAAAVRLDGAARLVTGLLVGSLFLFGAVANFWATRGRHPGWMVMAAAILLIAAGLARPG
jgi:hypothetical protein